MRSRLNGKKAASKRMLGRVRKGGIHMHAAAMQGNMKTSTSPRIKFLSMTLWNRTI